MSEMIPHHDEAPKGNYEEGLSYLEPLQEEIPEPMRWLKGFAAEHHVPILADDAGRFLRLFCELNRPKRILEIGCGISYSTHWMLMGAPEEARLVALDGNKDRLEICQKVLELSGFLDRVSLNHVMAEDYFEGALQGVTEGSSERFDLIFQDSAKKGYAGMLEGCYNLLQVGGYLVVDNIFYNHKVFKERHELSKKFRNGVEMLKSFNQTMAEDPRFQCHFFAVSDGLLVARKIK